MLTIFKEGSCGARWLTLIQHIPWERCRISCISLAIVGPNSHSQGMQRFGWFSSSPIQTTWALQEEVALQKEIGILLPLDVWVLNPRFLFYSPWGAYILVDISYLSFPLPSYWNHKAWGGQEERRILVMNSNLEIHQWIANSWLEIPPSGSTTKSMIIL